MSKRLPRSVRLMLAALCAAVCAPVAQAEKADRDKPINYQADAGDVNYQTKVGTLLGHVIVTQGTLTIHADKVILRQNPDNSLSATVYGNPLTFREKRDGYDEYYEGFAQRAEYDGQKRFLELFDRALLRKGQDEIRSNYISYNAETEFFKAEGRPDTRPPGADEPPLGARVRGVFQPQPKDDKAAKGGKSDKDEKAGVGKKSGGDDKSPKDDKAAAAAAKPPQPLPLKADGAIGTEGAR